MLESVVQENCEKEKGDPPAPGLAMNSAALGQAETIQTTFPSSCWDSLLLPLLCSLPLLC